MIARSCPDWPNLMELDPELQFKHYSVADARLPVDVITQLDERALNEAELCADLENRVFNGDHTDAAVAAALAAADWLEIRQWAEHKGAAPPDL